MFGNAGFHSFTQIWVKSVAQQFTKVALFFECLIVDVVAKKGLRYI